jgi:hypothetical protein
MIAGIANVSTLGAGGASATSSSSSSFSVQEISNAFLYLLIIQGLFSGLTIGKLAEGNIKAGIKHSFTMMVLSFLISTGANILFGK